MVVFPTCKINIGLQVISRRPDGFHNIRSIFYSIPYHDVLELIPASETKLFLYGHPVHGPLSDNLCLKAYKILRVDFPELPSYAIHLQKCIPMGAGLGGGSSDAAFMLRLLNEKANLNLTKEQLFRYAARLGSDCSFFIEKGPCLVEGKGDKLQSININSIKGYYLVLLCPKIHVDTAKAYSLIHPNDPKIILSELIKEPIKIWRESIKNDFEVPVFKLNPELKELKEMLYKKGAEYASLTGSGSALYGLFPHAVNLNDFNSEGVKTRIFYLNQ